MKKRTVKNKRKTKLFLWSLLEFLLVVSTCTGMVYGVVCLVNFAASLHDRPKYSSGNCLVNSSTEPWEKPVVFKIITVGKQHYLACFLRLGCSAEEDYISYPIWILNEYQQIDCPNENKN